MLKDAKLPVYRVDAADPQLSLLPMAARRALDCAGQHLSLKGWQTLALRDRQALVWLGAEEVVDRTRVAELLATCNADVRPTPPLAEPDPATGPSAELLDALPPTHDLSPERWRALSALDRYVFCQLARRAKIERLAEAYAEICGPRA
jgi:hypothetical protein